MFLRNSVAALFVSLTAFACSQAAEPPPAASSDSAVISDVLTMTQRADGKFDVVCRDQSRVVATTEDILANRVCGAGPSSSILGTIFGRSDSCSADTAVTNVRESTDCFTLSSTDIAWSISSNGQCNNISDTTVRGACLQLKPHANLIYGRSDSCDSSTAVAEVTDATDCFALSGTDIAWSVSVDGQCNNISDTNVRGACLALQPKGTIIYGRSDSCDQSTAIARITADTDCTKFNTTDIVWSISVDGQCNNISDTNTRSACITAQGSL